MYFLLFGVGFKDQYYIHVIFGLGFKVPYYIHVFWGFCFLKQCTYLLKLN